MTKIHLIDVSSSHLKDKCQNCRKRPKEVKLGIMVDPGRHIVLILAICKRCKMPYMNINPDSLKTDRKLKNIIDNYLDKRVYITI